MKKSLMSNMLILLFWMVYFTMSYNIMNWMIEESGFNGLFLMMIPSLWWMIIWPPLIMMSMYNIIFDLMIIKFNTNSNKMLFIKYLIPSSLLMLFQMFTFMKWDFSSIFLLWMTAIILLSTYIYLNKSKKE